MKIAITDISCKLAIFLTSCLFAGFYCRVTIVLVTCYSLFENQSIYLIKNETKSL